MSSIKVSLVAFTFVFGGALLGMVLRSVIPRNHLDTESKDVVKLGMGLVGTMAALVLGLLLASAKVYYDAQSAELIQASASIVVFDRVLAHYGSETKETREMLRGIVARALDRVWANERRDTPPLEPVSAANEALYDKIQTLSPKDEAQASLKSQALSMAGPELRTSAVDNL